MDKEDTESQSMARTLQGPQTRHSALTPEGEIEQAALFAHGLKAKRHGWRKVVVRAGLILIAGMTLTTLAFAIYYDRH